MNNESCNSRIEKYIDKVESIYEGGRDAGLLKIGQCLRSNFGLQGEALAEWLHELNRQKCSPPLSDADVTRIARSVDNSNNVPLGEENAVQAPTYAQKSRNTSKVTKRTEYSVTTGEPSKVADMLGKAVLLYTGCRCKTPEGTSTIGKILCSRSRFFCHWH